MLISLCVLNAFPTAYENLLLLFRKANAKFVCLTRLESTENPAFETIYSALLGTVFIKSEIDFRSLSKKVLSLTPQFLQGWPGSDTLDNLFMIAISSVHVLKTPTLNKHSFSVESNQPVVEFICELSIIVLKHIYQLILETLDNFEKGILENVEWESYLPNLKLIIQICSCPLMTCDDRAWRIISQIGTVIQKHASNIYPSFDGQFPALAEDVLLKGFLPLNPQPNISKESLKIHNGLEGFDQVKIRCFQVLDLVRKLCSREVDLINKPPVLFETKSKTGIIFSHSNTQKTPLSTKNINIFNQKWNTTESSPFSNEPSPFSSRIGMDVHPIDLEVEDFDPHPADTLNTLSFLGLSSPPQKRFILPKSSVKTTKPTPLNQPPPGLLRVEEDDGVFGLLSSHQQSMVSPWSVGFGGSGINWLDLVKDSKEFQ